MPMLENVSLAICETWAMTKGTRCRNRNLELATKAKACKGAGREKVQESHFMLSGMQESARD